MLDYFPSGHLLHRGGQATSLYLYAIIYRGSYIALLLYNRGATIPLTARLYLAMLAYGTRSTPQLI